MKDRIVLAVIMAIVLGAAAINSTDAINITVKTIFNGVGMGILLIIGLISFFQYIKRGRSRDKKSKS